MLECVGKNANLMRGVFQRLKNVASYVSHIPKCQALTGSLPYRRLKVILGHETNTHSLLSPLDLVDVQN